MHMTPEQQIQTLLERIARLEGRVAMLEARGMPYGPIHEPVWPNQPASPWDPPYTITCKLADGTTKEITFTSPIVAQTNEGQP